MARRAIACVTICLFPPAAAAQVIHSPLADLLVGGGNPDGIVLLDPRHPWDAWRFSDFTFRSTGDVLVNPEDVFVRTSLTDFGADRATLQLIYERDESVDLGNAIDFEVGYRADVVGPYYTLNRAGLRLSGAVPSQGAGNAALTVLGTRAALDGADLAPGAPVRDTEVLELYNDGPGRLEDINSAFLNVNPRSGVRVGNRLTLVPYGQEGGPIAVQTATTFLATPEPGAAAVLGATGAPLLLRRRQRS